MMPGSVAHILQIIVLAAGPYTFLGCGGPDIRPFLFTEEGAFKLNHAGIGEQQRRVVLRHQRGAAYDTMHMFLEIVQKALADLVASH